MGNTTNRIPHQVHRNHQAALDTHEKIKAAGAIQHAAVRDGNTQANAIRTRQSHNTSRDAYGGGGALVSPVYTDRPPVIASLPTPKAQSLSGVFQQNARPMATTNDNPMVPDVRDPKGVVRNGMPGGKIT